MECQNRGIEINIAGALYFEGYGHIFDPENAPPEVQERMSRWESLGAEFGGFTLHELAVGLAALPAGAKLVLGMKNVAEVESNLAAVRKAHTVPKELWREAQRRGMLTKELDV